MFVDNTDLFVTAKDEWETVETMLTRAQPVVDIWCRALWTTGGVLRPETCWWNSIVFESKRSKWKCQKLHNQDIQITVPDTNGMKRNVKRNATDVGERTLGVRMAADGNMKQELEYLVETTKNCGIQMQHSYLYRQEAILALSSTINRTWSFPLSQHRPFQRKNVTQSWCQHTIRFFQKWG